VNGINSSSTVSYFLQNEKKVWLQQESFLVEEE
jgi:hypothetical protein